MIRWKIVHVISAVFCLLFPCGNSKKVILLDTTESRTELKWTTYSAAGESDEGWLEETYTNMDTESSVLTSDGNYRAYVVCEVDKEQVDNWLRTPFVERGNANRLYIEVTFSMRDCKQFPYTARTCKETFTLLYYESEHDFTRSSEPNWSTSTYKLLDRIAADEGRFTSRTTNDGVAKLNTETRSIPVSQKGVYFAFRDEGACTSIVAVKVYYEVCEEIVAGFAWFPETATGSEFTSIQEVNGHCVDRANPINGAQPSYLCKADGTWDRLNGGCQCNVGYWAEGDRCIACMPGMFKELPGLGRCQPCPEHSNSRLEGSGICECDAGFYRAKNDDKSHPCTQPPDRPMNAKVLVNQDEATITWSSPAKTGGRKELWYRIVCQACPPSTQYSPGNVNRLNGTKIRLKGLVPDSIYNVMIYAENEVSEQLLNSPMYTVVEVRVPKVSPLLVRHFRVTSITNSQIILSWDPPEMSLEYYESRSESVPLLGAGGHVDMDNRVPGSYQTVDASSGVRQGAVKMYSIRYYPRDLPANITHENTIKTELTVSGLRPDREYMFNIRCFTDKGWGAWSGPLRTKTGRSFVTGTSEEIDGRSLSSHPSLPVIVVVAVSVLAFVVLGLVLFWRKRSKSVCHKKQPSSDLDALEYEKNTTGNLTPDYYHMHINATLNRKLTSPLMSPFSMVNPNIPGYKPYVDPLAYEDPNQALKDFAGEINADFVIIEEIIGGGEFGEVCKGKLRIPGKLEETVAIKTLKPGSTEKAKADFLAEASIMGQFDHENVIRLKGVVTKVEPVMIITEYMENRSLDSFLRAHDGKLDSLQLVSMLSGIAAGMQYLSEKGYVHRDLAARNVLVDRNLRCKIADFGLSRGLEGLEEQVYTTKGGKIPVRWTAPEAIAYRKFTSSSDVWSFGVLMWEVMSFGERPYWEWTNQDVIQKIDGGYRLPMPMDCPMALYALMRDCWQRERENRPTFDTILSALLGFLHRPELLYNTNSNSTISTPCGPASQSAVSLSSLNIPVHQVNTASVSLENFLRQIGMDHRFCFLYQQGITSVAALSRLTIVDLMNYGLSQADSQRLLEAAKMQMGTLPRRASNRTLVGTHTNGLNCGYQTVASGVRGDCDSGFFV